MTQQLSTANDFRQAFIKSLVEVDIPGYGVLQLRSSRYKVPVFEHNNLSPREFAVKLLSDLIYAPSFNLDEIQSWDDESIEKALRAWLAREDSNKWVFPEDVNFFKSIQHAYGGYLEDYLREMQKAMEPLVESIRHHAQLVAQSFGNLQSNLSRIADSIRIEIPKIQVGKFFEHLPDFTEVGKQLETFGKAAKAANILDESGYRFLLHYWSIGDVGEFAGIDRFDTKIRSAVVTNKLLHMIRQAEFTQMLEEYFQNSSILRRRWKVVEQALIAHKNRNYLLSIPALLAQVEGMFTDALVLKGMVIRVKGELYAKDGTGKPKLDKKGKPLQLHGLGQKVQNSDLQSEDILKGLAEFFVSSLVPERNSIMHGSYVTYKSARLSLQLVLNVYLLAAEFAAFENEK